MKREITRKEKVEDKAYRVADYGGYHGFYADGMQEYEIQANLKQRGYSSYYSETDDFRKRLLPLMSFSRFMMSWLWMVLERSFL